MGVLFQVSDWLAGDATPEAGGDLASLASRHEGPAVGTEDELGNSLAELHRLAD
jgi:hypothetical protein